MLDAVDLPDDIDALRAMLIASQLREVRKDERIERLEKLVAAFKQAAFGRKSEKVDPEQFDLALEDLETAIAAIHAEDKADSAPGKPQPKARAANRGSLSRPSSPCRRDHRPGKPDLQLWRRPALHRRGRIRASGYHSGAVPRHRHASSQICLPCLHRRRCPGSSACKVDSGWFADRGDHRAYVGVHMCRSPAALSGRLRS